MYLLLNYVIRNIDSYTGNRMINLKKILLVPLKLQPKISGIDLK